MSNDPFENVAPIGGGSHGAKKKRKPKPPSRLPDDVLTEDAVALMFTAQYGQRARFDHEMGRWVMWEPDALFWKQDRVQLAAHWCRDLARDASMGNAPKVLERVRRKSFLGGVEAMCRADPVHAVTHEVWDPDPMLLGCPGVTVDLRTGKMRAPIPEDMITRQAAVAPDPDADCPNWKSFIRSVTREDDDLERFLQAFLGYSLTGSIKEHQMLFIHGNGGNGKSLLLSTVMGIMGDYAQMASMDTFASSRYERHSTDLAAMRGARVVGVSEVSQGVGWNQQRLAQMTGGDRVRARFMRQDEFEYHPQFKLIVVGNHKPELSHVNEAMRRRMNIVPFTWKPEVPDQELALKLEPEWPAILQWLIRGCLEWQEHGLRKPQVICRETEEYFEEQDTFAQWLEECCIVDRRDKNCWDVLVDLYHSWKTFAEARLEPAGTAKTFGERLGECGFETAFKKIAGKSARVRLGVQLRRL
uniref:Phage/plasmid primase, P4 family n=1 Tax=Cereibacter sphaeroides (strain ATCC 17025 / ATH 2.4.3) TaxID=349102 RepID=A4WS87_CERS5